MIISNQQPIISIHYHVASNCSQQAIISHFCLFFPLLNKPYAEHWKYLLSHNSSLYILRLYKDVNRSILNDDWNFTESFLYLFSIFLIIICNNDLPQLTKIMIKRTKWRFPRSILYESFKLNFSLFFLWSTKLQFKQYVILIESSKNVQNSNYSLEYALYINYNMCSLNKQHVDLNVS